MTNMSYPNEHHPIFFLRNSLRELGASAEFNNRDERTLGCWGLIINGKPFAYLIDNRLDHEKVKEDPAARELLSRGVLVCHAQRPDYERVGGKWLPLAASPGYVNPWRADVYNDWKLVEKMDVGFVGYVRDFVRASILADVGAKYALNLAQGVFGQAAVDTYCQSKVGLNVPTRYTDPTAYDIPMRVTEIAACGVPLVTNYLPELEEIGFIDGINCITYHSPNEVCDAIRRAIDNPQIGSAGLQLIQERHTYEIRAKEVLGLLNMV